MNSNFLMHHLRLSPCSHEAQRPSLTSVGLTYTHRHSTQKHLRSSLYIRVFPQQERSLRSRSLSNRCVSTPGARYRNFGVWCSQPHTRIWFQPRFLLKGAAANQFVWSSLCFYTAAWSYRRQQWQMDHQIVFVLSPCHLCFCLCMRNYSRVSECVKVKPAPVMWNVSSLSSCRHTAPPPPPPTGRLYIRPQMVVKCVSLSYVCVC